MANEIQDIYELTPLQQGMLFHSLYSNEISAYNIQMSLQIEGQLDIGLLCECWSVMIQRHQVLRTSFIWEDVEKPYQVVHTESDFNLHQISLAIFDPSESASKLEDFIQKDRTDIFDLETSPLMRTSLIEVGPGNYHLIWTFHHIILEGWSASVILNELWTLYDAKVNGKSNPLSAVIPYSKYIQWLKHQDIQEAETFWKNKLKAYRAPLQLPIDKGDINKVSDVKSIKFISQNIPQDVSEQLLLFARKCRVTVNTVMEGALTLLLSRYTGEEDIIFGVALSGRPAELDGVESMVGLFVNVLPARIQLDDNKTIESWLQGIQTDQVEMREFEYTSLLQIKSWSELSGSQPVFNVALAFENWLGDIQSNVKAGGVDIYDNKVFHTSDQPLTFFVTAGKETGITLAYDTERYDDEAAERLLSCFVTTLTGLSSRSSASLADVSILPADEEQRLLYQWNQTENPLPHSRFVFQSIEEIAEKFPSQPALVSQDATLDFSSFNESANRLAHHLIASGADSSAPVTVLMDRSTDMIISLLAILKTGSHYVPIDPDYPEKRLAYILDATKSNIVITQSDLVSRLGEYSGHIICMDDITEKLDSYSASNPAVSVTPDHVAYIIYTSGSTGQPKGVEITHAGLSNLIAWHQREYQQGMNDRASHMAGLGFDATVWETWPNISCGVTLYLVPDETRMSVPAIWRWIVEQGITISFMATPLAEAVIADISAESLRDPNFVLRLLHIAGDKLHGALSKQALPFRVANLYGPTENTVCTTSVYIDVLAESEPTIGRPIDNVQTYVLDRNMHAVPVGVTGKLFIGGNSLAKGYFNQPELTMEKFVKNPFSRSSSKYLYDSGDLVRYTNDGEIEFVGRADDQVKIRGFRIELGEIEALLKGHAAVQSSVVTTYKPASGDNQLIAYIVLNTGMDCSEENLLSTCKERLPVYMLPAAFIFIDELPLTFNGKLDRKALPDPQLQRRNNDSHKIPANELEKNISLIWSDLLGIEDVGTRDNFFDLGGHSLLLSKLHTRLKDDIDIDVSMVDLFQYPSIETLASYISGASESSPVDEDIQQRATKQLHDSSNEDIAVIGMAGRFPGADDIRGFWNNLVDGVESIRFFTDDELHEAGIPESTIKSPGFIPARGYLDDAELFDAGFFAYSPSEAQIMDPQHRLFLECSWHALEHAACDPETYDGLIGVFAGASINQYFQNYQFTPEMSASSPMQTFISNEKDFLATRVSYKLDLRGPAFTIQTACSTSLVAIHEACRHLSDYSCDVALAGGVSVIVPRVGGSIYQQGSIVSPDGRCRAFDAEANGTVGGEGVGVVVLKRLSDAVADRDTIYAVVKGSAINNDGSDKAGFTAPGIHGQVDVIARAQANAGITSDTIDYVEAHGTGTTLGDPIEAAALMQAFSQHSSAAVLKKNRCALGAVKTNIGHLDSGAGVAGFIKTVLSINHAVIPASLNFTTINPKIDFKDSSFYVNTETQQWPTDSGHPRRAGISSFGIGGTNAHIILEQAPETESIANKDNAVGDSLIVLSAKSSFVLDQKIVQLAEIINAEPELNLNDIAYTLQSGRTMFSQRCMLVSNNVSDVALQLQRKDSETVFFGNGPISKKKIVFMCSGQGAQYPDMGKGLYRSYAVYRDIVDECCDILNAHIEINLLEILYPEAENLEWAEQQLTLTQYAQCALFVTEYATAKLWIHWGLQPAAMIGHSIGEYVAACLSGVFSLDDALVLVANRGRLMQAQPTGSMLSVPLPAAECLAFIPQELQADISIATINSPSMCVVSGEDSAITSLEELLQQKKTSVRRLHTSHAFHSAMMDGVIEPFVKLFDGIELHTPAIPFISNVTGNWIDDEQAQDKDYWAQHLRNTVLFSDGLKTLLQDNFNCFIEVGPGNTLATFTRQHSALVSERSDFTVLSSLKHPRQTQTDTAFINEAAGRLWLAGHPLNWSLFNKTGTARRIALPGYPFERQHYWLEARTENLLQDTAKQQPGKITDIAKWGYVPAWKSSQRVSVHQAEENNNSWMIFANDSVTCKAFIKHLEQSHANLIIVRAGDSFSALSPSVCTVNPGSVEDYALLFSDRNICAVQPERIIHCWGISDSLKNDDTVSADIMLHEYYSLLHITQSLISRWPDLTLHIDVLTQHSLGIDDQDIILPEKSMVTALLKVMSQEVMGLGYTVYDLLDNEIASRLKQQENEADLPAILQSILGRTAGSDDENQIIALRRNRRWKQSYEYLDLEEAQVDQIPLRLREQGVYIITGGLGGVGFALTNYLTDRVKAKVILTARTSIPEESQWQQYLQNNDPADRKALIIKQLQKLKLAGADVTAACCDVTEIQDMKALVDSVISEHGQINGVIHAAGLLAGSSLASIQLLGIKQCEQQFLPKVQGLLVLKQVFENYPLDFIMPVSSLSSVLGGLGFAAYSAANQFMDSLCQQQQNLGDTRWTSVNWDGWQFDQADDAGVVQDEKAGSFPNSLLLSATEGQAVFERILNMPSLPQIIISTGDLDSRLDKWIYPSKEEQATEITDNTAEQAHYERPALSSKLVEAETESQKKMSKIWMSLFNIKQIGMHDSFFELGGHSLLAVQAVGIIREKFEINITIDKFLELATIEKIASHIDALKWLETDTPGGNSSDADDRDEFEL